MATERDIDRGLAVQDFGNNCYCCGKGPLAGRALFLAPIGKTTFASLTSALAPVCGSCRTALKTMNKTKHMLALRKDAKRAIMTTRKRFVEEGFEANLFVESSRYD